MTTITAEIQSDLREMMADEAAAVLKGAKSAVMRQTNETKRDARSIAVAGLRQRGHRQFENSIRSRFYEDSPAGFVYAAWGYFDDGAFVDILAAHEEGATILPRRGRFLAIPFTPRGKSMFRILFDKKDKTKAPQRLPSRLAVAARRDAIELIPTRYGFLVVLLKGRGRQQQREILGELVRRVKLPKRLDFGGLEGKAGLGLETKLLLDIAVESERAEAARPRQKKLFSFLQGGRQ